MLSFPAFRGFVRGFVITCSLLYVAQLWALKSGIDPSSMIDPISNWGGLAPSKVFDGQIWRLVTWVFLHSPTILMHLLFNMLAFYFFGSLLEEVWGTRRILRFSFLSTLFSAVAICLAGLVGLGSMSIPTIGASGLVYAMIVSVARLYPNQLGVFLFVPMKMKYLAALVIAIDLINVLQGSSAGVSYIAHLSGALFGFLYVGSLKDKGQGGGSSRDWMNSIKEQVSQRRRRRHLRIVSSEERDDRKTYH